MSSQSKQTGVRIINDVELDYVWWGKEFEEEQVIKLPQNTSPNSYKRKYSNYVIWTLTTS